MTPSGCRRAASRPRATTAAGPAICSSRRRKRAPRRVLPDSPTSRVARDGPKTMATRHDADQRMWAQACELIADAERLHRQFFRLAVDPAPAAWEPPIDVFEDEREVVVVVAMPGVDAERIQVAREAGALVVRGARPLPFRGARGRLRQLEIPYG